jgi:Zn ribbon nucleic-acid-binding protein
VTQVWKLESFQVGGHCPNWSRAARLSSQLEDQLTLQSACVTSPHKGRKLTKTQKAHNRMVNSVRGPGERGFATLKTWRIFIKVRCCPQRVGAFAKAILTLELGPES